jgi:hypothetical protein
MPESKEKALKRAKKGGFDKSSVVKAKDDDYFIAPHGIKSSSAKHAYADLRSKGKDKETAAKIAWSIEKKNEEESLKGGKADNKSLEDIAKKHNVELSVIQKQFDKGLKVESEHTDDEEKAAEIVKDHLVEMADYYDNLDKMEKQNSKDWAQTYKAANFIEKGVCTYNDETIYLSQETLNRAMPTMKGRPVIIKHQKVTPQNMQEHAVGYVSSADFNTLEAGFDCDFLVFDDEGKEVIAKDYSVSCAYKPLAFGQGGTWHNTPYNREVTELEFTHLALVPDPRYEDAKIYENSKEEQIKENYNMDKIEVEQGFLASLMGMAGKVFQFENSKEKEEVKEKKEEEDDDDEMEYKGKKYSKKEVMNCYMTKKNEKEEKEANDMKEAIDKEDEKQNSKEKEEDTDSVEFFNEMAKKVAEGSAQRDKIEVYTQAQGLEKGKAIFG